MNIDDTWREEVDELLRNDLAIADQDASNGLKGANVFSDIGEIRGLPDGDVVTLSKNLDAWRSQVLAAATFAVWLGDNCGDIIAGFNKAGKGGEAKILSPKEYYFRGCRCHS